MKPETPTYAAGTKVPVEKSKMELDMLLAKHGAGKRAILNDDERAIAGMLFELGGRQYRIEVPMPRREDFAPKNLSEQPNGWFRWGAVQRETWVTERHAQACRERYRGLLLLIKAKLEVVRMGVSSFEREFLSDLILPNGRTAYQTLDVYMQKVLKEGYTGPPQLPEAR